MGKSINDYYSEKMKRLMDKQNASNDKLRIVAPPSETRETKDSTNREYYDKFRQNASKSPLNKNERINNREQPKQKQNTRFNQNASGNQYRDTHANKNVNPEQTELDRKQEEQRRQEAIITAQKARKNRKIRDGIISGVLIFVVIIALTILAYNLFFVVGEIVVEGELSYYTAEEIIEAADISDEHLFSFRESVTEHEIQLRCPLIESVDVQRKMPSKIVLKVVEEKPVFKVKIYDDEYSLSKSLRVINTSDTSELIRMILPPVGTAISGGNMEYINLRNDSYIYTVTQMIIDSELWGRVTSIDLSQKFDLKVTIDGKYYLLLGNTDSIETKLKIAVAVLNDDMFTDNKNKYRVDLSNMSETSVVMDNTLILDN